MASDGPFSPTKGFIFSYTKKVMGNMASGYSIYEFCSFPCKACMFAKCQYVPEGDEMRLMQLSDTGPSLGGFMMEHNKHDLL